MLLIKQTWLCYISEADVQWIYFIEFMHLMVNIYI